MTTPLQVFKVASLVTSIAALPLTWDATGLVNGDCAWATGAWNGICSGVPLGGFGSGAPTQGTATSAQAWLWAVEGSMMAFDIAIGGYLVENISPQIALAGVSLGLIISTVYVWWYAVPRLPQADKALSDEQKIEVLADLESPTE